MMLLAAFTGYNEQDAEQQGGNNSRAYFGPNVQSICRSALLLSVNVNISEFALCKLLRWKDTERIFYEDFIIQKELNESL